MYEDNQLNEPCAVEKDSGQEVSEDTQEQILNEALGDSYTIDETIVLAETEESENELVMGVISSEDLSAEEMVDALQNIEGIKYAEPNYKFKACGFTNWSDTYINDSWHLGEKGINVEKAPVAKSSKESIVLAVMDTGIAYDHPDLESRMWSAPESVDIGGEHGKDFSDFDDDPYDEEGHGTHCAGIIAAAADNDEGTVGVVGKNKVELMSVRVLDENGSGDLSQIVKAFDYLIDVKKQGVNIKAVNCSFGTEESSSILDSVIDRAGENGILTIAAAGNESWNIDEHSCIPGSSNSQYVISVASVDDDSSLSSYSNYGKNNVDVAAPGSNILSSISYNNYTPYLYDAEQVKNTTQVYGEFGGASIIKDIETGKPSVTPVLGTGYDGNKITDVEAFGASKMYTILSDSSRGYAELSITDGKENGAFQAGNNQKSLRWTIRNAKYGDKYILYFPYTKVDDDPYVSIVLKTHSDYDEHSGGDLWLGDVTIEEGDQGSINYHTSSERTRWVLGNDRTYNSIWHASGEHSVLYDKAKVRDLSYGSYGFGLVYEAWDEGDFYVDISSIAISSSQANERDFGSYDVASGTSMATPVVTGAVGLIAAARPDLNARELKKELLKTTKANKSLANKCLTGAVVDFSSYGSSVKPEDKNSSDAKKTVIKKPIERQKFVWGGKKLTSKVKVRIHEALAASKTPKKFTVKKKNGKAVLKWKKVRGINGYIVFRKTGKGRFIQIKKLSSKKKAFTDKTVKKGKHYKYIIVSYKKVAGTKAVRISPATKVKKLR